MTDHGPVHVKIVMNLAVRMLRLLMEAGVEPSVVHDYAMEPEDAEVARQIAERLAASMEQPGSPPASEQVPHE